MSDNVSNTTVQPGAATEAAAFLPPTPAPRVEDAYAIVFDAVCRDALPKAPEFLNFVDEFVHNNRTLAETTAGRAVVAQIQADLRIPHPGINTASPGFAEWYENQRRCKVWLSLMSARVGQLHEPGQLPNAWPLAHVEPGEAAVATADEGEATIAGGEATIAGGELAVEKPVDETSSAAEVEAFFRKTTPDDARIRLPKALDWLVNGIPVKMPWGWRRMPIPIAGIFRGAV